MKYTEFKDTVRKHPIINSKIFSHLTSNVNMLKRQISEWQRKGLLIKLRKGLYILNEADQQIHITRFFIANQLYSPSYISLESALSYYSIIPEGVYAITSISTKKTQLFENYYGSFQYHHIKSTCFDGFTIIKDENQMPVYIATREKAILDFLYLKTRKIKHFDESIFFESFRFQNISDLNTNKLMLLAKLFSSKKLMLLTNLLVNHLGNL